MYYIFNDNQLLKWCVQNKKLVKVLDELLTCHYDRHFTIFNLLLSSSKHNHKMKFIIVQKDNNLLGIARFKYNNKIKISSVIVNPKYRRQNICTNIIKFILKHALKYNKDILLDVKSDNIGAIKCYQKNGFIKIKTNKYNENIMQYVSK